MMAPAGQTLAGTFQLSGGAKLVQIAPDIEAQHITGVETRASGCRRDCATEAKRRKIKSPDKCINDPDERLGGNIVVNAGRKQTGLMAIMAFDEARHQTSSGVPR